VAHWLERWSVRIKGYWIGSGGLVQSIAMALVGDSHLSWRYSIFQRLAVPTCWSLRFIHNACSAVSCAYGTTMRACALP